MNSRLNDRFPYSPIRAILALYCVAFPSLTDQLLVLQASNSLMISRACVGAYVHSGNTGASDAYNGACSHLLLGDRRHVANPQQVQTNCPLERRNACLRRSTPQSPAI